MLKFKGITRENVIDVFSRDRKIPDGFAVAKESEVIRFLRNCTPANRALKTLEQALAAKSPAECLSNDHFALATWADSVFDYWMAQYPLEKQLESEIGKLRPLAIAITLAEKSFCSIGLHPLHMLLDQIYLGAVGWDAQQGSSARLFEQRIGHVVVKLLSWFDDRSLDISSVAESLAAAVERSNYRLEFDSQILFDDRKGADGERARRLIVAKFLNTVLAAGQNSQTICDFIGDDWFDSGVLTLEKYGIHSSQWREFSTVTEILVETLRPGSSNNESQKSADNTQPVGKLLPLVKQCLVSLANDADSMQDAMNLIEYVDLRSHTSSGLPPGKTELIDIAAFASEEAEYPGNLDLEKGGWYSIVTAAGPRRLKLVEIDMDSQESLFCNYGGRELKSFALDKLEQLFSSGDVKRLDEAMSFSLSLGTVLEQSGVFQLPEHKLVQENPPPLKKSVAPGPSSDPRVTGASLKPPAELTSATPSYEKDQQSPSSRVFPLQPQVTVDTQALDPNNPPIGAWLGFHDTERPLLARLVVFDREKSTYLFVNRAGIKVRELTEEALKSLIGQGLVDVLTPSSDFRTHVLSMRNPG